MNKYLQAITIVFLTTCITIQKSKANINAIDFKAVNYPAVQQVNIDFLIQNQSLYNRWVHIWDAKISKQEVVDHLILLYKAIDALPQKSTDANLLIGDIAHYLYNMEIEEYYQKAVDHYKAAKALSPKDYRVYWFMGNHYTLAAETVKGMECYKTAMDYQPLPMAHQLFWADYAVACATANMPATALYSAERSSSILGEKSYIETQLAMFKKGILHAPPADTIIKATDMWFMFGKDKSRAQITNWALGVKLDIDTAWKIQAHDYAKGQSYLTIAPPRITAQSGQKIGFSILMFIRSAKPDQSLSQFMDVFTAKYAVRKPVKLNVGQIDNCLAYEIIDKTMYPQIGGGHSYAIAFERSRPAYPGMAMEEPSVIPKSNDAGLQYHTSIRKFSRIGGKIYYFVLLDSCEFIHDESFAAFSKFIDKGLLVE